jgi:Contractile injection system tube protein
MAQAMLIGKLPAPGQVTFDINPEQITVQRRNQTKTKPRVTKGGNSPPTLKGSPPETVSLKKVVIDGEGTQDTCEQLITWMTPGGGLIGAVFGAIVSAAVSAVGGPTLNLATKPPQLTFVYGAGFIFECIIVQCSINYTRFDDLGRAIRAEIGQLQLGKVPSLLDIAAMLPTNPTSGGAPGRRSHVVTAGENLQTIATANFGAPRHWRSLAETNGVDDPLRLPPGRHLYLPNIEELSGSR